MTHIVAMWLQAQGTAPSRPTTAPPVYGYIPILLMFLIAMLLPVVLLWISRLLQRRVVDGKDSENSLPAEDGGEPVVDTRQRFSVRFYIIAMLFLVFEVAVVLLLPWAVIYDKLALFGLAEMLVFISVLVIGYYYAWRKGALDWA